jgi:SM-20-related protein
VRDGFLGAAALEVHRAAEALHAEGRLRRAGIGRGGDRRREDEVRGDETAWLRADEPGFSALWERFEVLRQSLSRDAYLGLSRFEVQLARYAGSGERYVRHRDAFAGPGNRRVTAILYLNPGWRPDHGGLLRLHVEERPVDLEPMLDRLVVFLSERIEHEVLPAYAPRYAATAWYYGPG